MWRNVVLIPRVGDFYVQSVESWIGILPNLGSHLLGSRELGASMCSLLTKKMLTLFVIIHNGTYMAVSLDR